MSWNPLNWFVRDSHGNSLNDLEATAADIRQREADLNQRRYQAGHISAAEFQEAEANSQAQFLSTQAQINEIPQEFAPVALANNLADSVASAASATRRTLSTAFPPWVWIVAILALLAYLIGPGTLGRLIPKEAK